jgi:hypothetical protein
MIRIDIEKAHSDPGKQPERWSSGPAPRVSVPGLREKPANETAETAVHPGLQQPLRRAPAARVNLSRGRVVIVDPDDAYGVRSRPWQWRRLRSGKVIAYTLDGSSHRMRDLLLHHYLLDVPQGMVVIHRNHNGLDNRRGNLLVVNKRRAYEHSLTRSGYPGVYWDADVDGWVVHELVGAEVVTTGPFASAEEAVAARQARSAAETHAAAIPTIDAEEREPLPADRKPGPEPLGSVRGVSPPRNTTGYAGVTFDTQNNSYVARCEDGKRRFPHLADAARAASIAITNRADREAHAGERMLRLGGYDLLLDSAIANWLPALGPWNVRRRPNGLLDLRRARRAADDPDADYTTAQDLIVAPGPDERVEFVNGDRLDLRTANLRLAARTRPLALTTALTDDGAEEEVDKAIHDAIISSFFPGRRRSKRSTI